MPIANIDVHTGLIRELVEEECERLDVPFRESLFDYLDIVEDQVRRCQSVTGDLLAFSRTPASDSEEIHINELLRKTVDLVNRLSEKKPMVEMDIDECIPVITGDPDRLGQVLVNIMNNALRAIEPNDKISVSTWVDGAGNVCIRFTDSGPGIPPDTVGRIFDPFFTTWAETGGTGLGLSISHYIIKEMNGSIDVESSPGHGTSFTVTLPGEDSEEGSSDRVS